MDNYLEHVVETVPFYGSRIRPKARHLGTFPLVAKRAITNQPLEFLSAVFAQERLRAATTSGSTGRPLVVYRDLASWYGFDYDSYRELLPFIPEMHKGLGPGSSAVVIVNDNPGRRPFIRVNPSLHNAFVVRLILSGDDAKDRRLVHLLRAMKLNLLYGRPRAIARLLEIDEANPPNAERIQPRAILCSGDNLYSDQRRRMERWFSCKVHNAYVSQELGFVGAECRAASGIHVFEKRAHVEVLQEGSISEEGKGELVGTNLENWAMAFVRYRTGDFGEIKRVPCDCGHRGITITVLTGRDSIYFEANGCRINPSVLNSVFESLPIQQFQMVQTEPGTFRVRWVPRDSGLDHSAINERLRHELVAKFAPASVQLHVEPVDEIGTHGQKVQRYILGGN